jgi:hypothetical protein
MRVGLMVRRLVRALRAGQQRRAARRSAKLHGFMALSDRALADIGVCRVDLQAAMSGMIRIEHISRVQGDREWMAPIHPLRRPGEAIAAADDMSAAA